MSTAFNPTLGDLTWTSCSAEIYKRTVDHCQLQIFASLKGLVQGIKYFRITLSNNVQFSNSGTTDGFPNKVWYFRCYQGNGYTIGASANDPENGTGSSDVGHTIMNNLPTGQGFSLASGTAVASQQQNVPLSLIFVNKETSVNDPNIESSKDGTVYNLFTTDNFASRYVPVQRKVRILTGYQNANNHGEAEDRFSKNPRLDLFQLNGECLVKDPNDGGARVFIKVAAMQAITHSPWAEITTQLTIPRLYRFQPLYNNVLKSSGGGTSVNNFNLAVDYQRGGSAQEISYSVTNFSTSESHFVDPISGTRNINFTTSTNRNIAPGVHQISALIERVDSDISNTKVSGTSAVELDRYASDHSFIESGKIIRAGIIDAEGFEEIDFMQAAFFPSNVEYQDDTQYHFRIVVTAEGYDGQALESIVERTTIKFPRLRPTALSRRNDNLTYGVNSTSYGNDHFALIDTNGDLIYGLEYQLDWFTVPADVSGANPKVKVLRGATELATIQLSSSDIGKWRDSDTSVPKSFFHNSGSPFNQPLNSLAHHIHTSYKARNGELTINAELTPSFFVFGSDSIIVPRHTFPQSVNNFGLSFITHYYEDGQGRIEWQIKSDNGSLSGDTVDIADGTGNSGHFTMKFRVRETVKESVLGNVGVVKEVDSIALPDDPEVSPGRFYIPYTPAVLNEADYLSRIELEIDYFYTPENTTRFATWHPKFTAAGYSPHKSGTLVLTDGFSDSSDGVSLLYQALTEQEEFDLAEAVNGCLMNAGESRLSDLTPTSGLFETTTTGDYALSGNKITFNFSADPSAYQFDNSTVRFGLGIQVEYKNSLNQDKKSNILVYNQLGDLLAAADGYSGTNDTAGRDDLAAVRDKLTDFSTTGGTSRTTEIEIDYGDTQWNISDIDVSKTITHKLYFYVEEFIDSTLNTVWEKILAQSAAYVQLLRDQGLSGIVYLDEDRNFLYPAGYDCENTIFGCQYEPWRTVDISSASNTAYSKNLRGLIRNHYSEFMTANNFTISLDEQTIGKINSTLTFDTNNIPAQPFKNTEFLIGYITFPYHGDIYQETETLLDSRAFLASDIQYTDLNLLENQGSGVNEYDLSNTTSLDVSGFDVTEDVNYLMFPMAYAKKVFGQDNFETNGVGTNIVANDLQESIDANKAVAYSHLIQFNSIGDFSIASEGVNATALGAVLTKNYRNIMVPNFNEIEFLEPIDNTPSDSDPVTTVPQVDVRFKYNQTEFETSRGDYFNISRENIRIERVIVQGGEEHVPTGEQSKVYDDNIFSLSGVDDNQKRIFTFDDTYSHAGESNDIVASSGVDMGSVYFYRYKLFPGFVYSPGGGSEKRVELTDITENTFDVLPNNLALAFNLAESIVLNYNKKHSQEITWEYTYSDNVDFVRQQNNEIYFDIYSRIKDDNNQDDSGREIKYQRKEFDKQKDLGWRLSGSVPWDISDLDSNDINSTYKFSHIFRYDRFTHDHRNELAILVRIEGELQSLGQSIQTHTSGANTIGVSTPGIILEPTDAMKISRHLTEEEKNISISRKFTVANQEFDLKNNLEQAPISITRKKAKVRGNKPYSSST